MDTKTKDLIESLDQTEEIGNEIKLQNQNKKTKKTKKNDEERNVRK